MGIKHDMFEVISFDALEFYVACLLKDKKNKITWRFVVVYGSTYDNFNLEFINELQNTTDAWMGPTIVGVTLAWLGVVIRRILH